MGLSSGRCVMALVALSLLLATSCQAAKDSGAEELPQVLGASHADATASRRLLRAWRNDRPVLSVAWNLKGPITRWVRAGSVVQFSWSRPGGLAYGHSRCRAKGTLKKPVNRAVVLVKIPRGRFWFYDNYKNNCSKQAVHIIGY